MLSLTLKRKIKFLLRKTTFDDWAVILKANKVNSNINEVNNEQAYYYYFFCNDVANQVS